MSFKPAATTPTSTLSLHDALPISGISEHVTDGEDLHEPRILTGSSERPGLGDHRDPDVLTNRSEEHTSELQSRVDLVCRLLPEKKNTLPRDRPRGGGRSSRS